MAEQRATTTLSGRPAAAYLVVVASVALATQLLPVATWLADVTYTLVGLSVVAAVLVGVRLHRPKARAAWLVIAAAQGLWVLGDTTYYWQQDVLHVTAFPTVSDAFYLLGYPVFAVGLAMLVKGRRRSPRDLGPLLDSVAMTTGLGMMIWVLLAKPTVEQMHDSGAAAALVAASYPAMDILLIAALGRMIASPRGRAPASRYLMAALALLITADTLSTALDLFTTNTVMPVEPLWLLSYAAWGAAALHPSMTRLSDPVTKAHLGFRGFRLLAVVVATMIGPAILAVHQITGVEVDLWAVIIGSAAMSALVVARMNNAIATIVGAHHSLEALQDELAVQATHDPLTGLANRVQSMRLLAGALGRTKRQQSTVGLLFLDLDGFKEVNDNFGHRAGDEVLREVGRRLATEIRDGDFAGRLGGDEFLVGIENVEDEQAAVTLANRLITSISHPIRIDEQTCVNVGASIGVSLGRGGSTDVETLVHEADLAVYQAKSTGKGRTELFSGQAREALRERNDIERALVVAMREDQLELHYQPIIHLSTGQVECYETLVRWQRPEHGLVYPDSFLPFAEASDLICDLDTWVLRAALAQLERWNTERRDYALQVAVNISGRHISQVRILEDIASALRSVNVMPPQLVIEVTETAPLDDVHAAANLEAIRAMGVIVSLDDFGTGYQSNAQLSRLPVDLLKIDRGFVDASSASARSLLELTVKAAHAFGLRVIAEGIEGQDELDLVLQLGCEYGQGYFLGRPAPADQWPSAGPNQLLAG